MKHMKFANIIARQSVTIEIDETTKMDVNLSRLTAVILRTEATAESIST